jgi:hypothetical protein
LCGLRPSFKRAKVLDHTQLGAESPHRDDPATNDHTIAVVLAEGDEKIDLARLGRKVQKGGHEVGRGQTDAKMAIFDRQRRPSL